MKKVIILMAAVFALSACYEEPKSIDYYSKHTDKAKSVLDKCDKNGDDSVNCYHANRGYRAGTAYEHMGDGKLQLDSKSY